MTNPVEDVRKLGQSIWYDNMSRSLLSSGELKGLIDGGVTGLTSNPTIFEKSITGSTDYDDALLTLIGRSCGADETLEALVVEDIGGAADLLRPVYDHTNGADGFVSVEVSPNLANDAERTIAEAERLFASLGRPNVMIKVPATPAGMPAIRRLIGEGINVNVTLIFSQDAYAEVREAYVSGIEDLVRSSGDPSKVASVASFFVSRVDTVVDSQLEQVLREKPELAKLRGKAAIANAKVAYDSFKKTFGADRFACLREQGARPQRPLWASTGTKNADYSDILYVETLIGMDTVNTMPPQTLAAFRQHGTAQSTLNQGLEAAERTLQALESSGISMKAVTDKLLEEGVQAFADSFDSLLRNIEEKRARLLVQR